MSDFDKEAEREKLREKYERDKEQREATEQMSELLLKGATMTNTHCGTCGDPIFRYDGQEFCPTCEEVVTDGEQSQQDAAQPKSTDEATDGTESTQADGTESTQADASEEATDASTERATDSTPSTSATAPSAATSENAVAADAAAAGGRDHPSARDVPSADPGRTDGTEGRDVSTAPETTDGADTSLATARLSLARTVTKLAREAEETTDLERSRAYLAATEEAADALAAVKRADR